MSMVIDKRHVPRTVKQLFKNRDNIRFNLAIQRNEVWDLERRSLFIHSLICGFPFPPAYAQDEGDNVLWMIDGKQRLTTIFSYMNNEFTLDNNTPDVNGESISGLKFEELEDVYKDAILDAQFGIYELRGLTDGLRDEVFHRLNAGMSLTAMELNRVLASSKIMGFVQEIAKQPFFLETIALANSGRKRFADEEVVLQIIKLAMNGWEAVGFSGKDIKQFVLELRDTGVPEDMQIAIKEVTEYLNKALPESNKHLKKVHIPMIFRYAFKAIKDGISPEQFGGWVQQFFKEYKVGNEYGMACAKGSAKKENVGRRIVEMGKHYEMNVYNADNYVKKPIMGAKKSFGIYDNIQGDVQNDIQNDSQDNIQGDVQNDIQNDSQDDVQDVKE